MKFNWKEMTTSQKCETVALVGLSLIAFIFIILDTTGKWANNVHFLLLSIISVIEAFFSWNKNRKFAFLDLFVAAIFAFYFFG